jgi:hypothetical protein
MLQFQNNPALLTSLAAVLVAAGVVDPAKPVRQDAAADTLYLARELEFVSAQSYEVLVDPIKGRQFVPFSWIVPDGAETYGYDMYDGFASAAWITDGASAVGNADAFKTRTSRKTYMFGSSYKYNIQELAAAQMAGGRPLDRERARFCRIGHEQFLETLIAEGDTERSIEGLTNSTTIPDVAPVVGTWDASTSTTDLMKDLDALVQAPEQTSKQNFKADTLILPLSVKPLLRQIFSTTDPRTVEKVWLANQDADGVKVIEYWNKLDDASALSGPKGLAFKKSNMVFEFLGSYDFRELPPQQSGFWFQILTYANVVGLCFRYPLAMAQMDLDASP